MGMQDAMWIDLEGAAQLGKLLDEIVTEQGSKSLNAAMRKATRKACKEILLPRARDLIPEDTGFLASQLRVRAVRRQRGLVGHSVGFPDPLFKGDTYYAGYHEFGYKLGKRPGARAKVYGGDTRAEVPADSFLRRPLYENEVRVRRFIADELREFVRTTNRRVPDRL